jgi:uncharacterized protein YjiS (DUF1127 family)
MADTITTLVGSFSRLWTRHFAPTEKRNWSIGGARPNPEIADPAHATNLADQLLTSLHNHNLRRRWKHELRALDDQQLRDIGVSRVEIERTAGRLRFWI